MQKILLTQILYKKRKMMSTRVFSAKRKSIKFEYEFLDGKKVEVEYKMPTTKMSENIMNAKTTVGEIKKYKEQLKDCLVHDDAEVVDNIINEMHENSNLIEFYYELMAQCQSESAKK
jgi:hypothetical protein